MRLGSILKKSPPTLEPEFYEVSYSGGHDGKRCSGQEDVTVDFGARSWL